MVVVAVRYHDESQSPGFASRVFEFSVKGFAFFWFAAVDQDEAVDCRNEVAVHTTKANDPNHRCHVVSASVRMSQARRVRRIKTCRMGVPAVTRGVSGSLNSPKVEPITTTTQPRPGRRSSQGQLRLRWPDIHVMAASIVKKPARLTITPTTTCACDAISPTTSTTIPTGTRNRPRSTGDAGDDRSWRSSRMSGLRLEERARSRQACAVRRWTAPWRFLLSFSAVRGRSGPNEPASSRGLDKPPSHLTLAG